MRKYEEKLGSQAALLKEYNGRASGLRQNHSASVDQAESMQGLLSVLEMKLGQLSRGNVGGAASPGHGAHQTFDTRGGNVLQF